jgi:polyhydroxyalkanoate synthase
VEPGALEVLGTPVDLSSITGDTYLVAGIADHITPWTSCYRSVALLGSRPRFVLSTSGHIAAMVNPPAATRRRSGSTTPCPRIGRVAARRHGGAGSWWEDWAWLGERSGGEREAPDTLGDDEHAPLVPAPGTYVRE